jgi:hypothetical protein
VCVAHGNRRSKHRRDRNIQACRATTTASVSESANVGNCRGSRAELGGPFFLLDRTPRGYVATLDLRLQRLEHLLDDLLRRHLTISAGPSSSSSSSPYGTTAPSPLSASSSHARSSPRRPPTLTSSASPASSYSSPQSPPASPASSSYPITPRFPTTALQPPPSTQEANSAPVIEGIEQAAAGALLPPLPFKLESKFLLSEVVLGGWSNGPITAEEREKWGILGDIAAKQGLQIEG